MPLSDIGRGTLRLLLTISLFRATLACAGTASAPAALVPGRVSPRDFSERGQDRPKRALGRKQDGAAQGQKGPGQDRRRARRALGGKVTGPGRPEAGKAQGQEGTEQERCRARRPLSGKGTWPGGPEGGRCRGTVLFYSEKCLYSRDYKENERLYYILTTFSHARN